MYKILLVFLFIISCSTFLPVKHEKVPQYGPKREEFLGYWVGEMSTKDGKFMRWLVERRIDGSFTLTHVIKDSPTDPRQFDPQKATFELGTWGVSGDIYFSATRQYYENGKIANFDTTQGSLYDAYKILFFDGKTMTYLSLETGEVFKVNKQPKDKKLEL
jgi:hypothetical protein